MQGWTTAETVITDNTTDSCSSGPEPLTIDLITCSQNGHFKCHRLSTGIYTWKLFHQGWAGRISTLNSPGKENLRAAYFLAVLWVLCKIKGLCYCLSLQQQPVLNSNQGMIEIQYWLWVVVLVWLHRIYILSQMGGRSVIENVNMSQGGSLGYISTLSSDINAQASFCGQGATRARSWKQWKANRWQGEVRTTGVAANWCTWPSRCQNHSLSVIDRDNS